MLIRLQKIIAEAGIASRRTAEKMIQDGLVTINGKTTREMGTKANPLKDHIKVAGRLIRAKTNSVYVIFHKPSGVVTTLSDPEGRPCVQDYLTGIKGRLYPVGRLDYDSEGLILLTNDGPLAHKMMHPSNRVPRTYEVKVKGVLSDKEISRLGSGIRLPGGKKGACRVEGVRKTTINSWIRMTLFEGQKRQIRRMIQSLGHSVIRLKRIQFGPVELGPLPAGEHRYLRPEEVYRLRSFLHLDSPTRSKGPAITRRTEVGSS